MPVPPPRRRAAALRLPRAALASLLCAAAARAVLVNNSAPMLGVDGAILDCADGTYTLHAGRWYAHCVSYGLCAAPVPLGCSQMPGLCGFRQDHNVSIFSSPDLSSGSWRFEALAFAYEARPPGILYRPHVVFNPNTGLWVLWANIVNRPVFQGYFAATALSVTGPFTVVADEVPLARQNCGDFDLLVDTDGAGYVIYTCGHVMGVEALAPDFLGAAALSGSPPTANFGPYFVEAPVLFHHGAAYYAIFGYCCCFCRQGSGAMVYTAPHPLGPWALASSAERPDGDVACVVPAGGGGARGGDAAKLLAAPAPEDTPDQGCAYQNGTARADTVSVTRSQQNVIITLPDGRLIWTGNRWGQAPDGIKGHEPQAWLPLEFDAAGNVQELKWLDAWSF
jgi:hypothetical protein